MNQSRLLASALGAVVLVALQAAVSHAVIVYAPNGSGGYNAYEVVTVGQTWVGAKAASQILFPGGAGVPNNSSVAGHLGTVGHATETVFQQRLQIGDPWIGLTDQAGDAPGAFEGGNQNLWPVPANGSTPLPGQRGYGWAWVTGEPLDYHNWNGTGEPNGGAGESHVHLTGGGAAWNDLNGAGVKNYVREWDLNLSSHPTPVPAFGTPGLLMSDVRDIGTVTNGNYKTLATTPPATANIAYTITPTINFGGGGNGNFAGDALFPLGGGDNFVTRFTGFIEIPTSGTWSFAMNQDDSIYFKIGNTSFEDLGCCNDTFTTMSLQAGFHPFEAIFGEFGGGEHVELAAFFGTSTTISDFRLIGDTANGGLRTFANLPEPASVAMWSLFGLGLVGFGYYRFRRKK